MAIHYPTRAGLADALWQRGASDVSLECASDHGVVYLWDAHRHGIELYGDCLASEWPQRTDGLLNMFTTGWIAPIYVAK